MSKSTIIEDMEKDFYLTANEKNKELAEEYLDNATHLSEKSLKQYRSALKIFISYVNKFCNNKNVTDMTSLEFKKYLNWLLKQGLFSAAIRLKKSAVSNLNNNILLFHEEEYPTFRNFTAGIKPPETGKKNIKEPITDDEYAKLCKHLEDKGAWQKLAYIKFSYDSGARRNEVRSVFKEVVNYEPIVKTVKVRDENGKELILPVKKYKTQPIKCKGKKSAELRKLSFDEDTLDYMKKWLEIRGEDNCPYMFVSPSKTGYNQVAETTFNDWCEEFSEFLGRRVYPHLFRSSRATSLFLSGKSMDSIKGLLGHKSVETTQIYIVKDDTDDEDEIFT